MSQTRTYQTEYRDLNAVKKVLDQLIQQGTFGKSAKVVVKGDPGFDTGVYYHYEPEKKQNIIFRIKDGGQEYFKEGFFDKGFAIAKDPKTGKIELVFDYNSTLDKNAQKVTEQVKKHVDDMLKTGTIAEEAEAKIRESGAENVNVHHESNTRTVIEGEFTAEQLREIINNQR